MNLRQIILKILHLTNLESEVDDMEKIHQVIEKDLIFKGTNLWILIFAILVASVGLNMNSTAVIIGAMLISPLMGPIIGLGYGIATYNFPLFRKALKNFSFAIFASIGASTLYFILSPISTAHSELLARTSPTIYDVLIALFGGLAGIVAISSKQKGNVIPGVAIATALMPPLCTAGYGLSSLQLDYFFGAIYLFTINTAFIAFSAMIVSQILKFPVRSEISELQKKKVNRIISVIILLIFIPSVFFGYRLVQKERFIENANKFVNNISVFEGNYLLKNTINPGERSILLIYAGISLNEEQKQRIIEKAKDFSLKDVQIKFRQGISLDEINSAKNETDDLKSENSHLQLLISAKQHLIDSLNANSRLGEQLYKESKILFPEISGCIYNRSPVYQGDSSESSLIDIIIVTFRSKMPSVEEKKKIEKWMRERIQSSNFKIIFELE